MSCLEKVACFETDMLLFMWSYILLTPFGELLYLRGALLSFIYVLLSQSSSVYRGGVRRTEESVYCLRCLNYCHCYVLSKLRFHLSVFRFNFSLSTLTTPSSRNPQGVTMPRYLRLIAAGVIEAYGFHLSVFRYTMNSLISQLPKRVTSLWVTPFISASIMRQKKPWLKARIFLSGYSRRTLSRNL